MDQQHTHEPNMQCPDIGVMLTHFLRQIESRHARTSTQEPSLLHWNSASEGLAEFGWPLNHATGARIPPGEWESLRRTHEFFAPCCLCSFLDKKPYTESRIAVTQVLSKSPIEEGSLMEGEYVATCASQRCGFLLHIEKLYFSSGLKLTLYAERASPVPVQELAYLRDFSKLHRRYDGLYQAMPKAIIRGTGGRLVSMSPEEADESMKNLLRHLSCGIAETRFWAIFVQCIDCGEVVFRYTMAAHHQCNGRKGYQQGISHSLQVLNPTTPPHTNTMPSSIRAQLEAILMDLPEDTPFYSLRPDSPVPTEIAEDGLDED